MPRFSISDSTADAILRGRLDPDDAPPDLWNVAALVSRAKGPATADELLDEQKAVTLIRVAIGKDSELTPGAPVPSSRTFGRLLPVKVMALAALFATGGGVAAAATGSLP